MPFRPTFETQIINVFDTKLAVPPGAFMQHYGNGTGIYEAHLSGTLFSVLEPGMIFIDIGANVGAYAIPAAKRIGPTGSVVAIEVDPRNAQCILYSASINGLSNLEVWPLAASDRLKPEALLQDARTNSGTRDLKSVIEQSYHLTIGMPIDNIALSKDRVDVIKIDIEAREYPAMMGARGTLSKFKPVVFSEFTPHAMRDVGGNDPIDYLNLFYALNYDAYVLHYPDGAVIPFAQDPNPLMALLGSPEYKEMKYLDLMFKHRGTSN